MNINQLTHAEAPYLSEGAVSASVEALVLAIKRQLASGQSVTIPELGRFRVYLSPERRGYDIKNRVATTIPAKYRAVFRLDPSVAVGGPPAPTTPEEDAP